MEIRVSKYYLHICSNSDFLYRLEEIGQVLLKVFPHRSLHSDVWLFYALFSYATCISLLLFPLNSTFQHTYLCARLCLSDDHFHFLKNSQHRKWLNVLEVKPFLPTQVYGWSRLSCTVRLQHSNRYWGKVAISVAVIQLLKQNKTPVSLQTSMLAES